MIVHMIFATIVLAIVLAAAHALPLRARTRCTLLLLGIAQFFVPTIPPRLLGIAPARGPAIIRVFGAPLSASSPAAPQHANSFAIVWAVVATLLMIRALIAYRSAALLIRRATPFEQRHRVAVLRSSEIDTPVLAGLFRPVILLPRYVDGLADAEVDALLMHECAHLARRDNVIAALESFAGALLWFHPLVWLTRRAIAIAREEACDEMVVAHAGAETYLSALAKVCRAAIAPRAATLSCMASNRLTERIGYMNKLQGLKAVPHRIVVACAVVLVAVAASAAGFAGDAPSQNDRYFVKPVMTPLGAHSVRFDLSVVDRATGDVQAQARVITDFGAVAQARSGTQNRDGSAREFVLSARTADGLNADIDLRVEENGVTVQTSHYAVTPNDHGSPENISISLKDADVHDVLKTLGKLTNKHVEVGPGIDGVVTLEVKDVPWTRVLDMVAKQAGATATIDGDTIRVTK
jgi:beta-lactamase regulating signal transducer with metallopeptidase domain